MQKTKLTLSVNEATDKAKTLLEEKQFTLFADINHTKNAESVDLAMPESRVLIFGNPQGGTKLMQKDISMSLDLPLRLAIIDDGGETYLLHQTTEDYCQQYQVEGHPVLENIEKLFSSLAEQLSS